MYYPNSYLLPNCNVTKACNDAVENIDIVSGDIFAYFYLIPMVLQAVFGFVAFKYGFIRI